MANQTNRQDELRALLERLNLGGMAAVFADLARNRRQREPLSRSLFVGTGQARGGAAHATAYRTTPACFCPSPRQDLPHF